MPHLYRTVVCKNPDCQKRFEYCYRGETKTSGEPFMSKMLGAVELECLICGTLHTYTDSDITAEWLENGPHSYRS